MQNAPSLKASLTGTPTGIPSDSYQTLPSHKTRVKTDSDGKTRVLLHSTPIVTFNENAVELNTGGWWTRTTKARMNQASQAYGLGFRVFQKAQDWFVDFAEETVAFTGDTLTLERRMGTEKGGGHDGNA